jgi:DNA-binding MarR family transcriptional regulator
MTENQKAILDKLIDEDMKTSELASELHIPTSNLKKILANMVSNNYIKKEGSYYSIAMDYNPPLDWNFKPLLGAWK